MTKSPWDRRIARAADLEKSCPPAAELLRFYRHIAEFQQTMARAFVPVLPVSHLESLLHVVIRTGPTPLVQTASALLGNPDRWESLILTPADPAEAFFARILLQPYQEIQARRSGTPKTSVQPSCPFCGDHPVVAVLRPEGDGGKRSLVCSLCFTEWDFRRLLCPHCGEENKDKLPIYTAEQFPHIRVEACETCRAYIKAVDLTLNGLAVPEVDELASVPLDLWATGKGYTKLQPNLFGI